MKDLGCISNIEVIDQLVALAGQFVIDAGCGDMTLSRQLAEHGARVLAIDPDPVQAARNQAASRSFNSRYTEADVRKAAVEEAFQRLGGPDHQFESHRQVMYLHGLREAIA